MSDSAHLRFLGHAAFALDVAGLRVVLDPHRPGALGGRFRLPEIVGPFDVLVVTHPHEDHNAWTPALGQPLRVERDTTIGALQVRCRAVPHDAEGGLRMGLSRMVRLQAPGFCLVHSGDLGTFDADDVAFAAGADVLLLAAGGTYTLGPDTAATFARAVGARVTVPMHCADAAIDLPLAPVEDFFAALGAPPCIVDNIDWPIAADLPTFAAMRRPDAAPIAA